MKEHDSLRFVYALSLEHDPFFFSFFLHDCVVILKDYLMQFLFPLHVGRNTIYPFTITLWFSGEAAIAFWAILCSRLVRASPPGRNPI